MTYQIILLLVSLTIFVSYITFIIINFGILPSISDSYYKLSLNSKFIFTLAMWGFAFPIIMLSENGLLFFSGAGICFVGAAPLFKEEFEGLIHRIGAITGIGLGLLALIIYYNSYYLVLLYVLIFLIIYLSKVNNRIWWIEILSFLTIIIGLLKFFLK
jgi:hypothetical protein